MTNRIDLPGAAELLQASAAGDASRVRELLESDSGLLGVWDESGNGALQLAALGGWPPNPGRVEAARLLLDAGADVNAPGHSDITGDASPLVLAASSGATSVEMISLLLQRGADPDARAGAGVTALQIASERGDRDVSEALLAGGATLDIHSAAALGMARQMREMLREDDSLAHARDRYRRATPLYYASLQNQKDAARLLLNYEADINATTNTGNTAVHVASAAPARRTLEFLLDEGGDVNARNYKLQTPLHYAVEEWWAEGSETMKLLILHGADVSAKDETRQTPLGKALARNKLHLAELLRKAGARD